MRALLCLALIAAGVAPAAAQPSASPPANDPALAPVAETFRADLAQIGRLATAAARIHARDGAFPASPFGLLGDAEAERAGARALSLRTIAVAPRGAGVQITAEPLPTDPYTPDRTRFEITLEARPDGRYDVQHEITRARAPEAGGTVLPYAVAGTYRVERAFGALCVVPAQPEGVVRPDVRVTPLGADAPVFYAESGAGLASACDGAPSVAAAATSAGARAEAP
ncbi:MAG: hypothetical protein ACK41D_03520 [Rubricoccaceae bacterium]